MLTFGGSTQLAQLVDGVDPLEAEPGLAGDREDVVHGGEGLGPFGLIRYVRAYKGQRSGAGVAEPLEPALGAGHVAASTEPG